jgi:hypothetical protein
MPALFISEVKYLGGPSLDFIEIAVTKGTDVSNIQVVIYNANGTIRSTNSLGSIVSTLDGKDVYVIDLATSATFTGLGKGNAVALVDNGVVDSFISFDDRPPVTATEGPANGLTSTQIGQAAGGESLETDDDGASYFTQTSPNSGTIPCFTPGTYISTPIGNRLVEDLAVGDLIITRDHGLQAIRWVGHKKISGARLFASPELRPIEIKKNAFGQGQPSKDMMVSPQHRMVINNNLGAKYYDSQELLVPAKALTPNTRIATASVIRTTYIHMLFDHHEIIFANGVATESFHPNRVIMNGLEHAVQDEIYQIFPNLRTSISTGYGPTAMPALSVSEGRLLAQAIWGAGNSRYGMVS